jgi:hypothetical protein
MKFDVDMPADLDQFGRNNSHGAVIGWKSLVQLRHNATDSRRLFNQMNIKAGIGEIQCGLHTGNAGTHYQYRTVNFRGHTVLLILFLKDGEED